ncbi:MAG: DNA mismatch repair endonuclease MutL [Candidatus Pacebacteria bacterium]|nr:DNA mismatch repair endonuclease MutL [Candidatus Paceibacterota bacterium]
MGNIKQLTNEVIAIIAAGEVAERPSQILKELIENSLDANSKNIEIRLENSGLDLISITDDGMGMSESDLKKCFLKHTTSKIITKEDLARVGSFGFRGEALSSIAGVSKLQIQSRQKGQDSGFKVLLEKGELIGQSPLGMPVGTTIRVEQLFAGVPARKKFLKNSALELRKVLEVVTEFALVNHTVSFVLFNNGKSLLHTGLGQSDLSQRVKYLLGSRISDQLVSLESSIDKLKISGLISKPQLSRKNNSKQFLYINSRPVSDHKISKIIKKTYGPLLEPHAYPVFVLNIELEPNQLDVNIHPHKRKVEFVDIGQILYFVQNAIEIALQENDLTYNFNQPSRQELTLRDRQTIGHTRDILKEKTEFFNVKEKPIEEEIIQIDNTYLIYPSAQGMVLVDQHAAHERILFEQFREEFLISDKNSTLLSKKVTIDLSISDLQKVKDLEQFLSKMGFRLDKSESDLYLTHVPLLMLEHDYLSLLSEIIDSYEIGFNEGLIDSQTIRVLNFLSCRNAIMAGEYLTMAERKNLIEKLDNTTGAYTCPHGRPVRVVMSVYELEKMFLRK